MAAWPESQWRRISWGGLGAVVALHALVAVWLLHAQSFVPARPPIILSLSLLMPGPVAPTPVVEPPPAVPPPPRRPRQPEPRPLPTPVVAEAAPAAVPVEPVPSPPVPAAQPDTAPPPVATPVRFDADYLDNPKPEYPLLSRRLHEEGRVVLYVRVSADGRPSDVRLHAGCGFRRLEEAALEAVRRWRFVPARRGNEPVADSVFVPIVFALKD